MVETWLATPSTNYGVLLKATNENTDGCDVRLRSSEYTDVSYRPYLEVYYTRTIAKKYYLKDHLGNIRVTIDANGVVKAYDDYYPFGLQMTGRTYISGLNNPLYKYSSKELDEENDLDWYYFGARYYDPRIGRWLSVDPLSKKYPSLNPYTYCANNPIILIDADGKEIDPILKGMIKTLLKPVFKFILKPLGITSSQRGSGILCQNEYILGKDKDGNIVFAGYAGTNDDGEVVYLDPKTQEKITAEEFFNRYEYEFDQEHSRDYYEKRREEKKKKAYDKSHKWLPDKLPNDDDDRNQFEDTDPFHTWHPEWHKTHPQKEDTPQ